MDIALTKLRRTAVDSENIIIAKLNNARNMKMILRAIHFKEVSVDFMSYFYCCYLKSAFAQMFAMRAY